jgi:hypothetical protein
MTDRVSVASMYIYDGRTTDSHTRALPRLHRRVMRFVRLTCGTDFDVVEGLEPIDSLEHGDSLGVRHPCGDERGGQG